MIFKILALTTSLMFVSGCKSFASDSSLNKTEIKSVKAQPVLQHDHNRDESPYHQTFLNPDNFMVNGHKVIILKEDFDKKYPKLDSTSTDFWDCGSPFEWLDEEWMTKTYGPKDEVSQIYENFNGEITSLYVNGSSFITNNHLVIMQGANTKQNVFNVMSPKITLDKNTTVEEFKRLFPFAEMDPGDNPNELRFRINTDNNQEDAFFFYFKNGKLKSVDLWYLLC